ncbi:MAG TPA: chemotaxis protein CheX [Bryobacteraceae bacterium]|nr:chemotaxis protein CheX [Bryobacteraceae bacterium]
MSHSTLHVEAYDTEVVRIVEDVLITMTQYEVGAGNTPYTVQSGRATCAIYFTGVWSGAVLLECSMPMAFEFTARLMGIPKPLQFDNDVFDALGELVNMIGGNLKSVLPRGVSLSLPSVVEGSSYSVRVCGANQLRRFSFDGPDGSFWVTLVETETSSSAS